MHKVVGILRKATLKVSTTRPFSTFLIPVLHRLDRVIFGLTNRRHTFTSFVAGLPVVMLITVGARSGERQTVPVVAFADGDRMVTIAYNHAKSRNPGWYHKLTADPRAETISDGETRRVLAREAHGKGRERLWKAGIDVFPGWTFFQKRAAPRRIPVMVLDFVG